MKRFGMVLLLVLGTEPAWAQRIVIRNANDPDNNASAVTVTHNFTIPAGSSIIDPILTTANKATLCARYAGSPSDYPLMGTADESRIAYQAFLYACTGNYTAANGGTIDTTGDAEAALVAGEFSCNADAGDAHYMYITTTDLTFEDGSRWFADYVIASTIWLWDQLSAGERDTLVACINRGVVAATSRSYGGRNDRLNNYHWAYQRNALVWALASYRLPFTMPAASGAGTACSWGPPTEAHTLERTICGMTQTQIAEYLLDEWELRWDDLVSYATTYPGGLPGDGTHYGWYMGGYYATMFIAAANFGRTLTDETNYFREMVYYILYSTSPKSTYHNFSAASAYQVLPWGENNLTGSGGRAEVSDENIGAFLTFMASAHAGTLMEDHIHYWLAEHDPLLNAWVKVYDANFGDAGTSLAAEPLDNYLPGSGFMYARSTWSNGVGDKPLLVHFQLGRGDGNHYQADAGQWQGIHNDRMFQETVTYGQPVPDYLGTTPIEDQRNPWPHNTVVCANQSLWTGATGRPTVRALTWHADFIHGTTDLRAYMGISTGTCATVDRSFVFVRGMKTLVVMARADRAAGATALTEILHCPTNPPAVSSGIWTCTNGSEVMRVLLYSCDIAGQTCGNTEIDESALADADCPGEDCQWQYRLQHQVTTASAGVAYTIAIVQWMSSGDAEVAATVTDGSPFTIALTMTGASNTTITVPKGTTWASGGSIDIGGSSTNFGATVTVPTVTAADGVSW